MANKVHLLVIDPQNDFCDKSGSLYVQGAENDMKRVAEMIDRIGDKLTKIHVTLDTHHLVDIAHPIFWKDNKGDNPKPFTVITMDDVKSGTWMAYLPSHQNKSLDYVTKLEQNNRYPLTIWPPHCLIGSFGHSIVPGLFDSLLKWESRFRMVNYVTKGSNFMTEHYSPFQADVPDPTDPSTQLNTNFIQVLENADMVLVAGEAKDYCVHNAVKDLINTFSDDSYIKKMVLLEDGMSNIAPNPDSDQFYQDCLSKGMQIKKTSEVLQ